MDLQVHQSIGFAENVAVRLRQFREILPEYSAEITNVVADLYAISATLTSLEGLARQFPRNYGQVKPDLDRVLASLQYTLKEITNSFEKLDRRSTTDNYRRIWHDLDLYFHEEDGYPLKRRLTKYKLFLQELQDVMQNKAVDIRFMTDLRRSILKLLEEQDARFAAHIASLSLSPPGSSMGSSINSGNSMEGHGVGKRRSYERPRPGNLPHIYPLHSPTSSHEDGPPPWVPDVPVSPISTSTTTQSNLSSAILNDHWAKDVFSHNGPAIGFSVTGESSKCLGDEVQQDIKDWLHKEGFDEVTYLPFNEGESFLSVFFYVREDDSRVRILCKAQKNRRPTKYYCLPLNLLEVRRLGPCLQLCRRRRSGSELVPWLNLQFRTMEKLVAFFCTFLALRSQDSHKQVQDIRDYELEAEKEMFGGLIVDDNYIHALRIYHDRLSGAIRLQASVHEGTMKRAPVWTAFITAYVESDSYWIRRNNNKVLLRELPQVIFYHEYTPPRTFRGDYLLKFTSENDARAFVNVIETLSLTD